MLTYFLHVMYLFYSLMLYILIMVHGKNQSLNIKKKCRFRYSLPNVSGINETELFFL